ncbi:alpha-hydroxy acid oxidase [Galactobacter caseinivorans]|uniref:Alpha-hydroxy-acid oxidizing protein n=1 Tax=Galactobacter caseinivorans TaxID=2676123 RepID=A0A496PJU6_9MICC|nr:alpha-hydroxy acid oxidase [Galactobacter caseinivorans]RKW70737.1 alpha-hydroxy-acid oxidizing protein [Galactobacter caseinivorans]
MSASQPSSGGAGESERFTFGARRIPRPADFAEYLKFKPLERNAITRRLAGAHTVEDLARLARRRTPKSVFEYVSGAAEAELSLARAQEAFSRVEFQPHVLRDVSAVDLTTSILGRESALPLILAPTGFTRMMQHEGEPAVARAAQTAGVPYALSTMGTTSIEELSSAAPDANLWFQLYLWKDRQKSLDLVDRARAAGWDTLVLTVDTPVAGNRLRDVRNGLSIPPKITPRTFANMSLYPQWWFNLLTTEPLEFASMRGSDGTPAELIGSLFDPSLQLADLGWLRERWDGKLVIKGIQDPQDARDVVAAGADALVVSNHGGRQLDRAPTPLELLPAVVEAVDGRAEVYMDTGITSGADMLAAVGLGATAVMVGRAYLYGLMAAGERGVGRVVEILHDEAVRTLQLMGAASLEELQGRVRLR